MKVDIFDCPFCNGTGESNILETVCNRCNGIGYFLVVPDTKILVIDKKEKERLQSLYKQRIYFSIEMVKL